MPKKTDNLQKKTAAYSGILRAILSHSREYPAIDYAQELKSLIERHPADKAAILAADKEVR